MERIGLSIGIGLLLTVFALVFGLVFPPIAGIIAMGFIPCWICASIFAYIRLAQTNN